MFFHISHNDLDGYGCQVFTRTLFKDITFFNVNYGEPITQALQKVLETSVAGDVLLISDLNLNDDQCLIVESIIEKGIDA